MSLDFGFSGIKNYEKVCWVPIGDGSGDMQVSVKTDRCIWGCMKVGLGAITAKNVDEWYDRYQLWKALQHQSLDLDLDDVKLHIGLTTNVHTERRKAWESKLRKEVS